MNALSGMRVLLYFKPSFAQELQPELLFIPMYFLGMHTLHPRSAEEVRRPNSTREWQA